MSSSTVTFVEHRLHLPTGVDLEQIRSLKRSEKIDLYAWHKHVAGDDDGRPWIPGAVRKLGIAAQLALAQNAHLHAAWVARETRRVEKSLPYYVQNYGHIRTGSDDDPGPAVPFTLWPEQIELLAVFRDDRWVIILKARQLGLTWLALHDAHHLMAFEPGGVSAVVLGLSQDGGYAKRLLERIERINSLLPRFLRQEEERVTRGSKSEFKLEGRGRFVSLPGQPASPRSWQSDLTICDEWAFVRNGYAGPTMRSVLPQTKRVLCLSTGDGAPDDLGNGQYFAQTYVKAREGENQFTAIFLPDSIDPKRTPEWRDRQREQFDGEEEFFSEHPMTDDQALIGAGKNRYFQLSWISAAVRLGGELDLLLGTPEMPPPYGEAIHMGIDWGENGVILPIWPLERGGVYIPPGEVYGGGVEPSEQTVTAHRSIAELQEIDPNTGSLWPPLGEARYDAAGAQSMRTFMAVTRERLYHQWLMGEVRSRKVPFNKYKTETGKYLKRIAKRAGDNRSTGVLAISPRNVQLIRQLRALESGPGGIWIKALDQDGPDALVAGAQRIARAHRELYGD